MNLDEIKNTWDEMSDIRSHDTFLDEESIRRITHEKSSSRLRRIIFFESIGMVVAICMIVYLLLNFHKLDNWLNLLGGYGTLTILVASLVLGANLIREAASINVSKNTYKKTLDSFTSFKKNLGFYKRFSILINLVFPFLLLPVFTTLFLEKNLLEDLGQFRDGLIISFLILPVLFYFMLRFYKSNISKVSKAFKDLEEDQI